MSILRFIEHPNLPQKENRIPKHPPQIRNHLIEFGRAGCKLRQVGDSVDAIPETQGHASVRPDILDQDAGVVFLDVDQKILKLVVLGISSYVDDTAQESDEEFVDLHGFLEPVGYDEDDAWTFIFLKAGRVGAVVSPRQREIREVVRDIWTVVWTKSSLVCRCRVAERLILSWFDITPGRVGAFELDEAYEVVC